MKDLKTGNILWLQGNPESDWELSKAEVLDPSGTQGGVIVKLLRPTSYRTRVHHSRLHLNRSAAYAATLAELQARMASTRAHMDRLSKAHEGASDA